MISDAKLLLLEVLREILQSTPDNYQAQLQYGQTLRDCQQSTEAEAAFRRAIELKPEEALPYIELCLLLESQRRWQDALELYLKALKSSVEHWALLYNLGNLLLSQKRYSEAITYYQKALQNPGTPPQCLNNLGTAFLKSGQIISALQCFEKAVQRLPSDIGFHLNFCATLNSVGQSEKSIELLLRLRKLVPSHYGIWSALCYASNFSVKKSIPEIFSFHKFSAIESVQTPDQHPVKSTDRRINVGYVSADFQEHSVSNFLGFFAHHDKTKFKIICYSNNRLHDEITKKIQNRVEEWREIYDLTDQAFASQITEDKIDVLVDLSGHTAGNRLSIFTQRMAPVQITYLGYPNTTGLNTIDLRITDSNCDPLDTSELYTEKLERMPRCFIAFEPRLPFQNDQTIPNNSIYEEKFCFGSYNNLSKINQEVIVVWSEILRQCPESLLIIKNRELSDPELCLRFLKTFELNQIESKRIILRPGNLSRQDHLLSYLNIDLALDTFPYSGTTTSCEALLMGTPLITLAGKTHRSRVGVSLLLAAKMEQEIADTQEAYLKKACQAYSLGKLTAENRSAIKRKFLESEVCDSSELAASLEEIYLSNLNIKISKAS